MRKARISARNGRVRAREARETIDGREDGGAARADAMFFRSQTLAIIRHFFEIASQIGRLPSILGREFFRARISHHAIPSFEEQAVFVHDVERALARLNEQDAEVVALVGLLHYTLDDAAALLGRSRSLVVQRFADSIDKLAESFLEARLLQESRPDRRVRRFPVETPVTEKTPPPKKTAGSANPDYHIVGHYDGARSYADGMRA